MQHPVTVVTYPHTFGSGGHPGIIKPNYPTYPVSFTWMVWDCSK
jgi:hypothetical protein